ncbi:MAG TPA: hypothetical protein VHL10_00750 [Nitrososphaera sp.]|jgi:hypothetical protein|nr:hypothetical protein [Nitrososphaera sp.]
MKYTRVAYSSAIGVILVLVALSQAAIQLTLWQETVTRDTATLLNRQELRTQRILRSSLLLLAPDPMDITINPLQMRPDQQLKDDLGFTQDTQTTLSNRNVAVADDIQAAQGEYEAMHTAGGQVLVAFQKHDRKAMVTAIAPLFLHEQKYLTAIYNAYAAQTQDADDQVSRVRLLELGVFLLTLMVVAYEVFGVVRPAYRQQSLKLEELQMSVTMLQEVIGAKRKGATE